MRLVEPITRSVTRVLESALLLLQREITPWRGSCAELGSSGRWWWWYIYTRPNPITAAIFKGGGAGGKARGSLSDPFRAKQPAPFRGPLLFHFPWQLSVYSIVRAHAGAKSIQHCRVATGCYNGMGARFFPLTKLLSLYSPPRAFHSI